MELQRQLAESRAGMQALLERQAQLSEHSEKMKQAFLCGICMVNNVSKLLLPCGHMLCRDCEEQIAQSAVGRMAGKCPFCRVAKERSVPYFPPI